MMKNKELWEPIFQNFRSTEVPEIYHPTEETDMKEPDIEHKLLLAEGTIKEIGKILYNKESQEQKIFWLKQTLMNYQIQKKEIETKGYLSLKTGEE